MMSTVMENTAEILLMATLIYQPPAKHSRQIKDQGQLYMQSLQKNVYITQFSCYLKFA